MDVEASDKVRETECQPKILRIKERVEEKEGIPPAQQRLIFGGKQMYVKQLYTNGRADDKTVKDFGIEGGTVLHVRMLA